MTPTQTRSRLFNSARYRAWVRLQKLHPADYERLFAEEITEGPITGDHVGTSLPPRRRAEGATPEQVRTIERLANSGWRDADIAEHLGEGWTRRRVCDLRYRRRIPSKHGRRRRSGGRP